MQETMVKLITHQLQMSALEEENCPSKNGYRYRSINYDSCSKWNVNDIIIINIQEDCLYVLM